MKKVHYLTLSLSIASLASAAEPTTARLDELLLKGLNFLEQEQIKVTEGEKYLKGEWPSYMVNLRYFPLLGENGKTAYDSNSFTTSSIHHSLSHIYLSQPQKPAIRAQILPLLENALPLIQSYRDGDSFNFWPLISWPTHLVEEGKTQADYPKIRNPNHYFLSTEFVVRGSNPVNDADDTALAFTAIRNQKTIADELRASGQTEWADRLQPTWEPEGGVGKVFGAWLDTEDRRWIHPTNIAMGIWHHTGAFMTWLAPEATSRTLTNEIPPYDYTPWIPYRKNDIDCVVNANTLTTLALHNELKTTPGVEAACEWLTDIAMESSYDKCGIYYPNRFNIHYVTAKAYASGAKCLDLPAGLMINDLVRKQTKKGTWLSPNVNKGDESQATVYALAALIKLAIEYKDHQPQTEKAIERGISHLISQVSETESTAQWKEGVFFTGGTVVRTSLSWQSAPLTTAIALEILADYQIWKTQDSE